tara:strand:- start:13888 stop:16380 length:2493 start_codon:yes stop_codon:yes gene_type:complete
MASLSGVASAQLTSPESHFGFSMGADRQLATWDQVASYYQLIAKEDRRVRVETLGATTEGRPLLLVTVASLDTLDRLDYYKDIQRRLADPRTTSPQQADTLISEGKTIVLITCSIHSNEVASTHTAVQFLYELLTKEDPRSQTILQNTIFLLMPSLNPDGVDKVAAWYRRFVGTQYEGAPLTELYHQYTGHDNNRDWYMFTQKETRLVVENVHNIWRPQIVYDVHQMGNRGARMFLPPWMDPIDPNIDSLIVQQVNQLGSAIAVDLTAAGKKGIVVNGIYDYFTPARHYQSYHGGLRLLSESAGVRFATPIKVPFFSLDVRSRGYNTRSRSWNFLEPWLGGTWRLQDIVDYQLITFQSCLYQAALQRENLLRNFYRIHSRTVNRKRPWGFVIRREQHDSNATKRLLETLSFGMVEIEKVNKGFSVAEEHFFTGDYLIRLAQPYGSFAKTLLEAQQYPDSREYPGGPPRSPYDVTAHSLPLLLGVEVIQLEYPVDVESVLVDQFEWDGKVDEDDILSFTSAASNAWKAVNRFFSAGIPVKRDPDTGEFLISVKGKAAQMISQMASELDISFVSPSAEILEHSRPIQYPRIAVYRGQVPLIDEGWTRWVLDEYEFSYESVGNERIQDGNLSLDYDVIVLPDALPSILHAGYIRGALYDGVEAPPDYTGGIEDVGAASLRRFMMDGGTVLALNRASTYAIERLDAPVRNILSGLGKQQFYAPGSLLNTQVNTKHPLTRGVRSNEAIWFESGPAFERNSLVSGDMTHNVMVFNAENILASGWLLGEEYLLNRSAVLDVPMGDGRLVLFGMRPQYRGQPNATFKILFNGLFYFPE